MSLENDAFRYDFLFVFNSSPNYGSISHHFLTYLIFYQEAKMSLG